MTAPVAGEVLFLAHRIPFPPDRGDSIRSWHLLRALTAQASVHCGCLIETAADADQVAAIAGVTASHCFAPRSRTLVRPALMALATGRPISVAAFASDRLARWVDHVIATRPIAAIVVFSGQMAGYIPARFPGRVVMDFVDVDSAKFASYAAAAKSGVVRYVHAREARLLSAHEQRAARRADVSLLVTPEERDLFVARLVEPAGIRVEVLGNGIDAALFAPDAVTPDPALAKTGPHIVFTGQMDYAPNVAAVEMFANAVMPAIRAQHPQAQFAVVGRAPVVAVRALHGVHGTHVTGEVVDVRPWLAGANVVVAPLMIARGVQNKVLEAMAMARAVVLTPQAATGIAATDGVHFAIANDAPALAARVLDLIAQPAKAAAMGVAAREFVQMQASWEKVLSPLPAMMGWADGV